MAGSGSERLYWMHFEAGRGGAHVVPAPVLVESVTGIQRVVYLLAKFTRGEELGQRAAFSRALREAFALQCRVPEPASYALPFEIGSAAHSPPVSGEADHVCRLFRRVTAAVGEGDVYGVRALVPDPRYLDCLGDAYRKATPPPRSGVSYRLEDHRRRTILDGRRTEATLDVLRGHAEPEQFVREDTISGTLAGMDFDEHRIRLKRPDGKSVSAYYDEESELPLIERRRGWVELTGDVLYDAHGRALSVTRARNFVVLDEDTIELRNVNLYNVAYRASPRCGSRSGTTRAMSCTTLTGSSGSPCRRPRGPTCTTSCTRRCPCCGSSTARSRRTGSRRRRGAYAPICASG